MDNTREKLIELLCKVQYQGNAVHGYQDKYIQNSELADHLIANGVTIQKWIPVTERLPEEDERVLVWVGENDSHFPVIDTDRVHKGMWVRWDEYITHWMPLPQPPKGE